MKILAQFNVPLKINKNKKSIKWWFLNLNNFIQISKFPAIRNAIKQKYQEEIMPILNALPVLKDPVEIIYLIDAKDARLFDISNVGAIVSKFVEDSLVQSGVLPDDNYKVIPSVRYVFNRINRENPVAQVFILAYDKPELPIK